MKKIAMLMICLLAAAAVQAELLDDFDGYTAGPVSTVITNGLWVTDATDADAVIEVDPDDPYNQCMSTAEAGGSGGAAQTGTYAVLDSATQIPDGTTKTLFMRCRINSATTDQAIGLTSVDVPTTHGAGDWNEFHACFRLTAGNIDVRDGSSWLTNLNNRALTVNTWYNVWFVVNNAAGTGSDTVQLYLTTTDADATEADRLYSTANNKYEFSFRVQDADTLDRLYWRAQDGTATPADKVYIDFVNISPGIDLSYPSSLRPYEPIVEQGTASGTNVPTTLKWNAGLDPDGVYAVNPAIVDQYVFIGTDLDPNLLYAGATTVDESAWDYSDPSSEFSFTGSLDRIYYWAVVEAMAGSEQAFSAGDKIDLVDPNNIVGPTWSYESTKSAPTLTGQPVDARVFTTDAEASFTVTFTSLVNPVAVTWYRNDIELTGSETDVTIVTDEYASSTLTIATPELADENKYYAKLSVQDGTEDDLYSATRLLVIKKELASFEFEQNLEDTSGNSAPAGVVKTVSLADPNELAATVVASPAYVDGIDGYAVSLDGTQFIDLGIEGYPKAGPLDTIGDARGEGYEKQGFGRGMERGSILCWVQPASTGAVYTNANGQDNTHFGLTAPAANQARHIVRGSNWDNSYQELGTAAGSLNMTDFTLQDGKWHMLAATWDDGGVRVYINGEQVASASAGVPEIYTAWERPNLVGAGRSAAPNRHILNSLLTGAIDSLRMYNYVKTADEIALEYKALSGNTPCANHAFDGSEYNYDNTASSYCKVDLADFAVIAANWLTDGLYDGN